MTEQRRAVTRKKKNVRPATGNQAHKRILPSNDLGTSTSPIRTRAALLRDPRLNPHQKQEIARKISQTYGNSYLQRVLAESRNDLQRKENFYSGANGMVDYVALVKAAEQKFPGRSPRQMLATLRQVYYGKPWSTSPTKQWEDVLPKSPNMDDPRSQLGSGQGSLFAALQSSQVVGGTDIGHLLTGLEALLDPQQSVEVEVAGPNPTVKMPNTEFATWGGDLGSAAGQMMADAMTKSGLKSPQHYFNEMASGADMEGNIDAYVLNKGASSAGGLGKLLGMGAKPDEKMPISKILSQYYLSPSSALGKAHQNRYAQFAGLLGGKIQDKKIVNQSDLLDPISTRITEFAYLWVLKEVKKKSGKRIALGLWANEATLKSALMPVSRSMTKLFLNWLENKL